MAQRRLFVGLAPEEDVAAALHEAALRTFDPREWRLYAARDIHLTLCFLGAVDEERVEPLVSALAAGCTGLAVPAVEITGLGAFPDARRPRVAWTGVRGPEREMAALHAIEAAAGQAIESAGLSYDRRPVFSPHLTLARPRGRASLDADAAAFGTAWPWRPRAVLLFESAGGAGERYPRRVVAALAGG